MIRISGDFKIEIRLSIRGKLAYRLKVLKKHYAVANYTDLIRFLITKNYEQLIDEEKIEK